MTVPNPVTRTAYSMSCPKCGSANTDLQATGRKTGVVVGGLAGGASGYAGVISGAEAGAAVAAIINRHPSVLTLGSLVGALAGFLSGVRLGHAVGAEVDRRLLRLHRCHDCGEEFRA